MKNENKLIAEFLGYELLDGTDGNCYRQKGGWEILMLDDGKGNTDFPYDTDWNMLMPVVDKCKINRNSENRYWVNIYHSLEECDIDITYYAVVEFIKIHNENNQLNENKLIAEFMGLKTEIFSQSKKRNYYRTEFNSGTWYEEEELSYDISWDWLMEVANKIIEEHTDKLDLTELKDSLQTTNIKLVYKAVINFIKNKTK